jgi:hypothetical protein
MRNYAIPLAVASAALLAACASPSAPAPSPSTGTAITASTHVAEHTAPTSHSPIPARKVGPSVAPVRGGTYCALARLHDTGKDTDGRTYLCERTSATARPRWVEKPMWESVSPSATAG